MADKDHEKPTANTSESHNKDTESCDLENFVTGIYQKQKDEGKLDTSPEIGEDRTNEFFARALSESRRMNTEVEKSNQKLAMLHAEFGLDMVNAWHTEHASEVLSTHEQELVKQAQYRAPTENRQGDM